MQIIVFPHGVGTMWKAVDESANQVARLFFENIVEQVKERRSSLYFGLALHQAVELVRDGKGDEGLRIKNAANIVTRWALFIHMGC